MVGRAKPHHGTTTPTTTAKLLGVCAQCPVRAECRRDALSETRYTVEGSWGGVTRPERTKALRQVADEMAAAD